MDEIPNFKEDYMNFLNIKSTEIEPKIFYRQNNDKLLNDYNQIESQLKKLEKDNRMIFKKFFIFKNENENLETKLKSFSTIEEEYRELKLKFKYEGQKIKENEKKENEIIILRSENSTLKKELENLELRNKNNENKMIEYEKKYQEFEKRNTYLEKRNKEYKNKIKDLTNKLEELYKKKVDLENEILEKEIKKYYNVDNNLINKTFKNNNSTFLKEILRYNKKKLPILNLLKKDYLYFNDYKNLKSNSIKKIKSNIIASSYKNNIYEISDKKNVPINKEFIMDNLQRNNSVPIFRVVDKEKNKSIDKYLYKSDSKNNENNKLLSSNSKYSIYPLTSKNSGNNDGHIVRKYIQKEFEKNSSTYFRQNSSFY